MSDQVQLTRAEALAEVRAHLAKAFPQAQIQTNEDANPATPFVVRLSWNAGRIFKVVRADSPLSTVQQFLNKAMPTFERFSEENVPSRFKA